MNLQNLMNHLNPMFHLFLKYPMFDLIPKNLLNHLNPKYLMFLKYLMFG